MENASRTHCVVMIKKKMKKKMKINLKCKKKINSLSSTKQNVVVKKK